MGHDPEARPRTILGCTPEEASRLLHGRPVTPGEVEAAARIHYDWRRHLHDPDSYWVTISQASRILGMRPKAVRKLLDSKRLPHITHTSGVRLMRRHEIEAIARQSPHPVITSMARA